MLGPAGTVFRGHEFHHSRLTSPPDAETIYVATGWRGEGAEGYRRGRVLASYIHAHWGSNPRIAAALVAACQGDRAGAVQEPSCSNSQPSTSAS